VQNIDLISVGTVNYCKDNGGGHKGLNFEFFAFIICGSFYLI